MRTHDECFKEYIERGTELHEKYHKLLDRIKALEDELDTENCPDCRAEIIRKCSDCGKIFSDE